MNTEIENEFLGILLLKPENMKRVLITDVCFLNPDNRFIFNLFKRQFQDINNLDLIGIVENYKHLFSTKFPIERIVNEINQMVTQTFLLSNFDYYQETLFSRYIEHQILDAINNFQKQNISKDEMLQMIHKYESMGLKTEKGRLSKEEIFSMINSKNKNLQFRFKKVSNLANIQEHDLVIIAARTGIGKSGFCLNLMEELANNYNCLYFNMEMSEKQVYQRLIGINTGVATKYHDSPKTEYQLETIKQGCENVSRKKIKIFNQVPTVSNIRQKVMMESKNEHTMVFIDHVGLIKSVEKGTTYEKTTSIVKELRQISLDCDCTIFLVSQLSRNQDQKKRPNIHELRDTGELEQSATTVLLLHDENSDNNRSKKEIEIEIIIGKNRNGQLGITKLKYNKENQRFDDPKGSTREPNSWRKE